jgi:RES domain-containing protein
MEQLVHLIKPRVLSGFVIASVAFDDAHLQRLDVRALPKNWADAVAPPALKKFGDDWVAAGMQLALAVPSAVMPGEWNYLLNPAHPAFAALPKSAPEAFTYDSRLT